MTAENLEVLSDISSEVPSTALPPASLEDPSLEDPEALEDALERAALFKQMKDNLGGKLLPGLSAPNKPQAPLLPDCISLGGVAACGLLGPQDPFWKLCANFSFGCWPFACCTRPVANLLA